MVAPRPTSLAWLIAFERKCDLTRELMSCQKRRILTLVASSPSVRWSKSHQLVLLDGAAIVRARREYLVIGRQILPRRTWANGVVGIATTSKANLGCRPTSECRISILLEALDIRPVMSNMRVFYPTMRCQQVARRPGVHR